MGGGAGKGTRLDTSDDSALRLVAVGAGYFGTVGKV